MLVIGYCLFSITVYAERIVTFLLLDKIGTTDFVFSKLISLTFIGVIVLSIIYSYYLVKKFNSEYDQLIDYKNNLEQKVRIRTHELEAAKNQIEEQSRQKTALFINLAHETKTPLTLIQNYLAKYLENHPPDQELAVVKYNIDKLTRDMVNFLDTEKLERSQVFYNHDQICALSSLVQDKTILFKETAAQKKIGLERQIEKDLYIKADPAAIDRVLNNLLDNAVKYTENRGKIRVKLFREDTLIRLIVSDTGTGISDEESKHIFSPYHQLSHTKRNIQGLGIGLHITKLIMDSLDGSITVNSTPDKGSEFIITFREYEQQAGDAVPENAGLSQPLEPVKINPADLQAGRHDPGKRTIFIVEDNLQLVVYLKKELENTYNVYYAVNGKAALEKLTAVPEPDIILSDIMMDIMDGLRFREEVIKREPFRGIPFIFLTAKTGRNERLQGLAHGAVDYICKPFDLKELKEKIKSWILLIDLKKIDESIDLELKHRRRLDNFSKEYNIKSREKEVLSLLLTGYRNNIIAEKMFISTNTVKKHLERIRNKLGVAGKKELMECVFNYIYK